MSAILGISALYHDSAAALLVDGRIVAAAQEERFTRIKHDSSMPANAITWCLREAGLSAEQLDYVGFYDKPLLKLDRLLATYLSVAPAGFWSFAKAMPPWLKQKLHVRRELDRALGGRHRKRFIFTEHHESHAASAFYPSPFESAAILTVDGVGEWATASLGVGEGHRLRLDEELRFPHSLGLLYSAFTYFCGFKVSSGEYKLMGLAPYGEPRFVEAILEHLVDLREDGSFRMDMSYFNYCQGLTMTGPKFAALFGGPPRPREAPLTQREMDLAASIQKVTEEILLRMARHAHAKTGQKNLCLAGGVALNCVANRRLMREGPFENVFVQPASDDAGGSLGVALLIWHHLLGNARAVRLPDAQDGSFLGPRFETREVERSLEKAGARYRRFETSQALCEHVAQLIAQGNVVGWFQGRMEFGPRALGGRSIVADPRRHEMQSVMNLKIKFRESFRPFAPSVLRRRAHEYFDVSELQDSPYMTTIAPVHASRCREVDGGARGLQKLKQERSDIPAVTHVDYTARLQTVDPERHGRFNELLEAFERQTGCPVLINTSFNVRGEPIVCSPEDAYRCFLATEIDALVLEDCVLLKTEQGVAPSALAQDHLRQFELD